jgi:glycosyltransferase involved in cell wall biosynthesis
MEKNKLPKVSVLMPNYNNSEYLIGAIESIINQTYTNFEFIIVDDCSTDNSWKIIQEYAKKYKKIMCFRNEKNLNIVKTRNNLFNLADKNSKYLAIFDSDDISLSKRLEKQVEFLENNVEYGLVGSQVYIIDETNKIIGKRYYQTNYDKLKKKMIFKSPVAQPSVMLRREIIESIGDYSDKYEVCEDYDLWFRVLKKYKIVNLKVFLLKYRITKTQSKNKKLKLTIRNTIKIQSKYLFNKKYFSFFGLIYFLLENILLVLPNKLILKLFLILEIKK